MRTRFYGTRGSIPTPGPSTVRYGGNTSCVQVRSNSGTLVLLDMGTGAAVLGRELMAAGKKVRGHILIGHTHWDHIQGLPFFAPLFVPGNEWDIYAPRGLQQSVRETLAGQMQHTYFPVDLEQLGANIRYHELVEGEFRAGDISVQARYLNHTALTLGYRLECDGISVAYACDHEPHARGLAEGSSDISGPDEEHAQFLREADLVIHDAQYLAKEYPTKIGWGHSTVEYAVSVARFASAKRLALTHHDPQRTDTDIDALLQRVQSQVAENKETAGLEVFAAAEGQEIDLVGDHAAHEMGEETAIAEVGDALTDSRALLVMGSAEKAKSLTAALNLDDVAVFVSSFAEATSAAARVNPSVVVIEDKAGSETTRKLRDMQGADGMAIPIIRVAAGEDHSSNKEHAAAAAEGLADLLVEPFSPSYARARIRAALIRRACRWQRAEKPKNEAERLEALEKLGILDTPPEERFDRLTRLAAALFDTPVALMSIIDKDRQWFKSATGTDIRESSRDESFCAHTILGDDPLIIRDALLDDRFAENPAVIGPTRVRSYAGYPMTLSDGSCIGSFCVVDTRPREFDDANIQLLKDLAELAVRELEKK